MLNLKHPVKAHRAVGIHLSKELLRLLEGRRQRGITRERTNAIGAVRSFEGRLGHDFVLEDKEVAGRCVLRSVAVVQEREGLLAVFCIVDSCECLGLLYIKISKYVD